MTYPLASHRLTAGQLREATTALASLPHRLLPHELAEASLGLTCVHPATKARRSFPKPQL